MTQTEKFCPAVHFEDKGKPTHPSLAFAHLSGLEITLCGPCGFWFQISIPIGTMQAEELAGTMRSDPWRGSGPKASLDVILCRHAVEKKKAKSFHVVLYICGSIYRAWCALIPEETFSLPALWALIAGPEGRTQHYHQARLRAAEWHFPFMPPPTPTTGQSAPWRSPRPRLAASTSGR